MRILHTADWHLGKKLDHFNRFDEQKNVLAEICQIADERGVDMVIVAGDLFDTFNPGNDATDLLYRTLKKLAKNGTVPIIAIAGNHDSPDRVNVADVLARECGIVFIGRPTDVVPTHVIENGFEIISSDEGFIELKLNQYDFPVRILHTAFANEVRLKEYFGEEKQQSLQECLHNKWHTKATRYCCNKGVNILSTHLFMMKRGASVPDEPDGEKPINIGNADLIYTDIIPPQIQYVALGHMHRFQDIGETQPVVYSGSPLCYSFAEAGQQKYVAIVEIEPGATAIVEKVPLQSGRKLHKIQFSVFDDAIAWLGDNTDCLVELTLESDDFLKAEERRLLYQSHDGIIRLIPKVKSQSHNNADAGAINVEQDIKSLFKDYFKSKYAGQEPNEDILQLLNEILTH